MEEVTYENKFICRACLKIVEQTTQSFGYVDDATGNLRDMLMCCVPELDIYVSPNPIICFSCIQCLIQVHNFKARCINTENIIHTYIQKYSLSDQNPINLGAVVRDLVGINNLHKQQAELKYQIEKSKLATALQHSRPPPPLQLIQGVQTPKNIAVHNSQQVLPVNTFVSDAGNLAQSTLAPLKHSERINGLEHVQNAHKKPFLFIPFNNVPSTDPANKPNEVVSNEPECDSIVNINEKNSTNDHQNIEKSKNKLYVHPIERKARLIVRIPRSELIMPFEGDTEKFPDINNDNSNSNEIIEDQEMTSSDDKMKSDKKDPISTECNPDNEEKIPNNHITKIFNCSCMYLTTSVTLYEEHKKKCKTGKITSKHIHKCPHCPHITNRGYALNKHINTMHTRAMWFLCDFCTYRSTDKACLRRHVRKNHEQGSSIEKPRSYTCTICDMVISSEYNFNRHMLKHEDTALSTFNCEFCSYQCKDRSNYRKHVFTHSPKVLQCPSCSYTNVSPYPLKYHIRQKHGSVGIEAADCKSEITVHELVKEIKALRDSISICQEDQQMMGHQQQIEDCTENGEIVKDPITNEFMENHAMFENPEISRFMDSHDLFGTQGFAGFGESQEMVETS